MLALTRAPSARLADCELSFLERRPIDIERAREQHRAYRHALCGAGARVVELPALDELPDSSFVEDTALVLDELAIIAPMGAASRRPESAAIAEALAAHRRVVSLRQPATLDGGDVLRVGTTLWVGQTPRTNAPAVAQLKDLLEPLGYRVLSVPITECLHLKSACARLDDATVLMHPAWIAREVFDGLEVVTVPPEEPWGANVLRIGDVVILPSSEPQTRNMLDRRGYHTVAVDVSEFQKAEAGVTCLSLILQ
jgi:dimethylargininase